MKKENLAIMQPSVKGFTLIELLVVIAIIAILVVIVVVAINPAERLREATDRRANTNVRASGTLLSGCITRTAGNLNACDTVGEIEAAAGGDGKLAINVAANGVLIGVAGTPAGSAARLCLWEQGRTSNPSPGNFYIYSTATGSVTTLTATPTAATCP